MANARQLMAARSVWSGGKKLPYKRDLEYLVCDGNQYVDTKIIPIEGMSFSSKFMMTGVGATFALFGTRLGFQSSNVSFWPRIDGILQHRFSYGEPHSVNGDLRGKVCEVLLSREGSQVSTEHEIYICGRLYGDISQSLASMLLGTSRADNQDNIFKQYGFVGRIYNFKINVGENVLCDLIPVESNEGSIEMFDKVTQTFVERHGDFLYGEIE